MRNWARTACRDRAEGRRRSWDRNLANLAKLALAGLYRQTSRDNEAIALYNEIVAKPSATVSASVAQLDLADLYAAEGKQDQARALWAKVKDADKDGAAGRSPHKSWPPSRTASPAEKKPRVLARRP